jgi:hypothetical protein
LDIALVLGRESCLGLGEAKSNEIDESKSQPERHEEQITRKEQGIVMDLM